jgi:hypothetical protein
VRSNNGGTLRKLLGGKIVAGNTEGKPRLSCLDDVEWDLMHMGVRIWETGTVGGTKWASVVTEAKDVLREL